MEMIVYKSVEGTVNIPIESTYGILYRNNFRWYTPVTYLSAAIRKIDGVKWNHGGVFVNNWRKLFINEALGKGYVNRPIEKVLRRSYSRILIIAPHKPIDEETFCVNSNSYLGTKYDFQHTLLDQLWYRGRINFIRFCNRVFGTKWDETKVKFTGHKGEYGKKRLACTKAMGLMYNLPGWEKMSPSDIIKLTGPDPEKHFFKIIYQEPI